MTRRGDDRGFTLVEVLVVVVILGIIFGVITNALVMGFRTTAQADERFAESHDPQSVQRYFPYDVASAASGSVDTSPGAATGCSSPSSGTNVVRLQWSETLQLPSPVTTTFSVAYRLVGTSAPLSLERHACRDGGAATVMVLARTLAADTCATPCAAVSGARVTLTLKGRSGYSYSIAARRRTP